MKRPHSNRDWMGTLVTFAGCTDTLESVFGDDDISPGILSRRLWAYVKTRNLAVKTRANQTLGGEQPPVREQTRPMDDIDDVRSYRRTG